MNSDQPFSFIDFKKHNNDPAISGIDYVHAVYATTPLHFDLLIHYAQLFSPDMTVMDGRVFIRELYDENRHHALLESTEDADHAQYWMNLLEITGLFDDLTTEQAIALARIMSQSWNNKLLTEYGSSYGEARYIYDADSDEVFVTLARQPL
ncbi:MAG: hypothetical protein ACN6P1_08855 [Pseudomonas sp.]|uniref:hypothetical protein n=1 Tax=Pseudomonas sp. TaxID=306 RepID=UPI003D0E8834